MVMLVYSLLFIYLLSIYVNSIHASSNFASSLSSLAVPKKMGNVEKKLDKKALKKKQSTESKSSKSPVDIEETVLKNKSALGSDDKQIQNVYLGLMFFTKIVSSFGSMILWQKIRSLKAPKLSTRLIRTSFASYLVFCQLLYFVIRFLISKANDRTLLEIKSQMSNLPFKLDSLPMGGILENVATKLFKSTTMTVKDYDMQQLNNCFRLLLAEVIFASIAHLLKPLSNIPLYVAAMGLQSKLNAPIVQVHLFRFPTINSHKRPFNTYVPEEESPEIVKSIEKDVPVVISESAKVDEEVNVEVTKPKETENKSDRKSSKKGSNLKTKASLKKAKLNSDVNIEEKKPMIENKVEPISAVESPDHTSSQSTNIDILDDEIDLDDIDQAKVDDEIDKLLKEATKSFES